MQMKFLGIIMKKGIEMNKPTPRNRKRKDKIKQILDVIEPNLLYFTSSQEFVNIVGIKKNENQYTDAFCAFINRKCNYFFQFSREVSQNGSSTIDIGIRNEYVIIFTIEAKLLPTPLKPKSRNEYEYVYGKGGGIQRFKDLKHGLNDQNELLPINGMIGFIIKNEFSEWFSVINGWIFDASWPSSEFLIQKHFENDTLYFSNHKRIDGSDLTLHHFWIKI